MSVLHFLFFQAEDGIRDESVTGVQTCGSEEHTSELQSHSHLVCRLLEFRRVLRSEEHTSELQSQSHLVCRLLLEKKNNTGPAKREQNQSARVRDQQNSASVQCSATLYFVRSITYQFFRLLLFFCFFFFLMIRRPPRSTLFPTRRSSD